MVWRILVLPGSSSPVGSEHYRQVYETVENEAARRGFVCKTVIYPGQQGISSGILNQSSAMTHVLQICRGFKPDWIIARSFGCCVAVGILGSEENWIKRCRGAVLWGPCLSKTIDRIWRTAEEKQTEVKEYVKYNTFLSGDFFDDYPTMEDLIQKAGSNLRLIRGGKDEFNTKEDLDYLADIHGQHQPGYAREIIEIPGLTHTVIHGEVTQGLLSMYFDSLFNPNIPHN